MGFESTRFSSRRLLFHFPLAVLNAWPNMPSHFSHFFPFVRCFFSSMVSAVSFDVRVLGFSTFFFPFFKNKIWKYEFLLVFLRRRIQSHACGECELHHGKHDFHNFFSLRFSASFFARILYSWHFVAHFTVHLVLAIFRPRSKKNDCHRKEENEEMFIQALAPARSFSLLFFISSNVVDKTNASRWHKKKPKCKFKMWRKIAISSQCQVPSDFCMCCKLLLSSILSHTLSTLGSVHVALKIKQLSE